MRRISLTLFFLLISFSLFAEYRAYQYLVWNKLATPDEEGYQDISTLDPQSYVAYHGGNSAIKIKLMRSWHCLGKTSFEEICSGPIESYLNSKEGAALAN